VLEISIPSSIEYLPLVDTVCQAFCAWAGIHHDEADGISMAAVEAATNAVVHGNKCQRSKKMKATFEKTSCKLSISIMDEGEGFDPKAVPDPTAEENLLKESGRGIFIMNQIMDGVDFEISTHTGTRITLSKDLPEAQCGRVLAIDYGHKRLGLALSDELRITAQPFGNIEVESPDERITQIEKIIKDNEVSEVVVGLPLTLEGHVSRSASRVIGFAIDLNRRLDMPVTTWDERLSTKQSERILIEAGVKRKNRKGVVDAMAAAVFLQSYLDARKSK
jgi:putative Holliday junction resolvase